MSLKMRPGRRIRQMRIAHEFGVLRQVDTKMTESRAVLVKRRRDRSRTGANKDRGNGLAYK